MRLYETLYDIGHVAVDLAPPDPAWPEGEKGVRVETDAEGNPTVEHKPTQIERIRMPDGAMLPNRFRALTGDTIRGAKWMLFKMRNDVAAQIKPTMKRHDLDGLKKAIEQGKECYEQIRLLQCVTPFLAETDAEVDASLMPFDELRYEMRTRILRGGRSRRRC